jgi:hypothetical protein
VNHRLVLAAVDPKPLAVTRRRPSTIHPAMRKDRDSLGKTALQIAGVLGLLLICSVVFHKALSDIAALADRHAGRQFWVELGRYIFKNLAGG